MRDASELAQLFGLEGEQESREVAVKELVALLDRERCRGCNRPINEGSMRSYEGPTWQPRHVVIECTCGNWVGVQFKWKSNKQVMSLSWQIDFFGQGTHETET